MTVRKHRVVCRREADTVGGVIYTHRDSDGPAVEVALTRDLWDAPHRGRVAIAGVPTRAWAALTVFLAVGLLAALAYACA